MDSRRQIATRIAQVLVLSVVWTLGATAHGQDRGFAQRGPAATSEKRVALVIGNGAYATARLTNPPNDARDVAAKLEQLGFEVTVVVDGDRRAMERAIVDFGRNLKAGGVGLFFFAGHGIQASGQNYLIPTDARIEDEELVSVEAVQLGSVLARMEAAKNRLNIVILDACRNNPFARSWRSAAGAGLVGSDAPSGTIVAFATGPGQVAADGDGRNSPYTRALLSHIATPGARIEDVFKAVRADVQTATQGRQTPWENSALTGDFAFAPGAPDASPCPAGTRLEGNACVPLIVKGCPEGYVFMAGQGCIDTKQNDLQAKSGGSGGGKEEVQGELEPTILAKVVRQGTASAQRCYDRDVAKVGPFNATVTMTWMVDADGHVSGVRVKELRVGTTPGSSARPSELVPCLTAVIQRWTFPRPEGGGQVSVSYPFSFSTH